MSQLFASPDEPQAEPSSPSAVKVDNFPVAPTPDAPASAPEVSPYTPPSEANTDALFGAPVAPPVASIDYTVPVVPPGHVRPERTRKGLVAGLAAMALAVGTAGGVGGAAAWQQWGPSDSSSAQVATLPVSSTTGSAQQPWDPWPPSRGPLCRPSCRSRPRRRRVLRPARASSFGPMAPSLPITTLLRVQTERSRSCSAMVTSRTPR